MLSEVTDIIQRLLTVCFGQLVAYANAVAGLCCTKWETVPSYHTAEEVDAFIRTHSIGQF